MHTRPKKRSLLFAVILLLLGAALGMQIDAAVSGDDTFEQLKKLEDAFLVIDRQYVEKVNPKVLAESAIAGMLKALDPHSTFIPAEEVAELQESYRGSFGGIGIWFEPAATEKDTAKVTSTIPDGPSEMVGLMPGDRIVAINDSSAIGMNSQAIQKRLKGLVGTKVKVTVIRPGARRPLDFVITRDQIPLYSIDSAYMVDDRTGYVRIGRFAMTTHQEFVEHMRRLKARGMQRLILDLRDNPGGIKQTAVQVADELLKAGKTIVYTRGRNPAESEVDRSTPGGLFEEEPVIVLVNGNSASGSEIVAGALQDHDRALIVGRRTFGKALVQRPFPLSDGSVLQVTVSRYYTPAGRLIQTPYENGDLEGYFEQKVATRELNLDEVPDSLKYKTAHGRVVVGGGGILPDVVVTADSTHPFLAPVVMAVRERALDVRFIRDWFNRHERALREQWADRQEAFMQTFEVDEALWQEFWRYAAEEGPLHLVSDGAAAPAEGRFARSEAEAHRAVLATLLKARLAQRLYRSEAGYPIFNPIEPDFQQAMQLWKRAEALAAFHIR
ncbi:S41 family peptidase [Rhodocaloribacter litoris]|uniref:S41 family peptidase n=1 Tax=Rhodocaloribacter litoris TaxID=2558931 RepID=UPI00141F7569|nr:S41 family peptidase [Rhodocaloribacter litoris]QXD15482.1 S41 family peptidase [Rhodocaloribacter litoris]